jgi:hypothetical protein
MKGILVEDSSSDEKLAVLAFKRCGVGRFWLVFNQPAPRLMSSR